MHLEFVETIKIKDGKVCNYAGHLRRAEQTMRHWQLPVSFPAEQVLLQHNPYPHGVVKCRVLYGINEWMVEYDLYSIRPIKSLKLIEDNTIDYSFKYANRKPLNDLVAMKGNADEILIVKNGYITDTSYTNVVFRKDNQLYTPFSYLLNGTKRQHLIAEGIITEIEIKADDIALFDTVILINAMIDIEDLVEIEIRNIM
ncbi:MAG: aminotransferase class IV [Marinifilaceae bacterium]